MSALLHLPPERRALTHSFSTADPFPHIVVEDVIDGATVDLLLAEFPPPQQMEIHHRDRTSRKAASSRRASWGPTTRELIDTLNGPDTLSWLEEITTIDGLIPDPYYLGGGLHQISRGGHLGVHADFNLHEHLGLQRRLNLLLYLNKDWDERWGGHLQLWDRSMSRAVQTIAPTAARMVVFATTDTSFHGHPDPLDCPPSVTRRSIALYYYTVPTQATSGHGTLYQRRPGTRDHTVTHTVWDRARRRLRALRPEDGP